MNIDEWAADQCGIVLYTPKQINEHGMYCYDDWGNDFDYEWTIQDPRCREIVREHFKINTSYIDRNKWRSVEMKWRKKEPDSTGSYCISATGKTIAEAEIACIEAIYEASKNGS